MDTKKRILLGAIGGLTPYLVTLLSIDFKAVVVSFELLDWVGLAIRCLVLIFLGALVAYLHKSETEQFKVFQLGLAAPALLATFINSNSGANEAIPTLVTEPRPVVFGVIGRAYAADEKQYINRGMLRETKVEASSRFLRGLLGTKLKTSNSETYFVIVGSHLKRKTALRQVQNLEKEGYEAKVYNPYFHSKYFAVVIASNVTKEEAEGVYEQALADGLPSDSYIWTY